MRVRGPEDLLAVVPFRLGFHPTDSLVVVALDGPRRRFGLTMRFDLPGASDVPAMAAYVTDLLEQHDATDVLVLAYAEDDEVAGPLVRALLSALERARITVPGAYRSDGSRWFCYTCDRPCCPAEGMPYDVSAHPLAAEHVLAGEVALPDREAVRAKTAAISGPSRAAMETCFGRIENDIGAAPEGTGPGAELWVDDMERFVADWLKSPRVLHPDEVARLAIWASSVPDRDRAWSMMGRADAELHRELWLQVLRRVVPPYEPAVACLAGFAAWLSGDGALAWCAIDRALAADPGCRPAELIRQLLEHAVSPRAWEELGGAA